MEITENSETKTWLGSSISDICKGKGPWSFTINPVNVCKYHAVLYNLPVTLTCPPKPHHSSQPQHWNEDHVRMPYSDKNLYPVVENGRDVIKSRWLIIKETLSKPINNSKELEAAIMKYNNSLPRFSALHYFFEEILSEDEVEYFFSNLLPKIIKLALQLPEIVPGSLPLLKKNHNRSVSLSQLQIASLLANAFLCTFPWKKDVASSYPGVNFVRLFAAHGRPKRHTCVSEKFKCIMHYFRRVTDRSPVGTMTFERKFIPRGNMPRWDACEHNLGNTRIHINSEGTIEDDGQGFLQGYGCVQEEIRFVICPELIISRLFVEQLGDHEAIIVTGPERYSRYSGYGDSFKWEGNVHDQTPVDEYGRRRTSICIIDATRFNKPSDQFYPSAILRELNKAYVGFSSREKENLAPVATGNWGCGAFRGSCELKSLIQLMACSIAGRDLIYFSFGNEKLRDEFYNMHLFLANNRYNYGGFYVVFQYWAFHQKICTPIFNKLFFDNKKQPTIKKFFGVSPKLKENNTPSTSKETKKVDNSGTQINDNRNGGTSECKSPPATEVMDDVDEDIIAATPPEDLAYKGKNAKMKFKLPTEQTNDKMPKTDIAELIDILDRNANKSREQDKAGSFLAELDKLKVIRNKESNESKSYIVEVEKPEVDSCTTNESVSLLNSPTSESKTSKRKITDYFQLKPSKSS
ncbi:hypothetical protein NQ318_021336 [Aromia moschata]|uniref:poly(ADP-ribose) glycohydrolase n=1 Tax=Aromia moschata TaxID=1265417 RepID=A0AAV8ZDH9_9CUCU|nr:hypothetical protein NQ318_021336 [Aromia moschata]